jgi:hypothetical protein
MSEKEHATDGEPRANELPASDDGYPPVDFTTFVLSLGTSALMHLGEPLPGAPGPGEVSLPLARQTIDLLSLIEQKTRGNLTGEEERLLAQLLFDLRLRYVDKAKQIAKP